MKTSLTIAAVLAASCIWISCDKKEYPPDPVYPVSTLSASISGKAFSTNDVAAGLSASSVSIAGIVNSGTSKAMSISLSVPHYVTLGSYPIDTATTARYSDVAGTFVAVSGSVTISAFNEVHVAGTFSFEAATSGGDKKSITGGQFDFYR